MSHGNRWCDRWCSTAQQRRGSSHFFKSSTTTTVAASVRLAVSPAACGHLDRGFTVGCSHVPAGSTLVVGCVADLSELTAALRKHGLRLSDADIRLLADDADEDGNQEIDMEEFATLIEKVRLPPLLLLPCSLSPCNPLAATFSCLPANLPLALQLTRSVNGIGLVLFRLQVFAALRPWHGE